MAIWRKVITSGSQAHLKSLVTEIPGLGVPAGIDDANPPNISASAIFASSSNGGAVGDIDKIAIISDTAGVNEIFYTGSSALTTTVNELTFGDGISGSLITPSSTGWDGTTSGTILIDSSSLADDGLTGALTANKIAVDISSLAGTGTNRNINFDGDNGNRIDVDVQDSGIGGFGTTATSQFSSDGLAIKTDASSTATTFINSSNQLTASIGNFLGTLNGGNGIELGSGYDGSSDPTVIFDPSEVAGTGIESEGNTLKISTGSLTAPLTANSALIFNQTTFITSSITDNGTDAIRVGKADGTTKVTTDASNFTVVGAFTARNESNFSVKDKFILINSGSNVGEADAEFGFIGETGSISLNEGIGWNLKSQRWGMTTGSLSTTGVGGFSIGSIPLFLTTNNLATNEPEDIKKGNMIKNADGDLYIYAPIP